MSRTYVVGLPVSITVDGDLVTYDVDTSEAAEAVEQDDGHLEYEGDLAEDIAAIEADHNRRALSMAVAQLGTLAAIPQSDLTLDQSRAFDALVRFIRQSPVVP